MCCVASSTSVQACTPQDDGLSSCRNLLYSNAQNALIQMQALAIIVGNIFAFIVRRLSKKTPEAVIAYDLTTADLLMGVDLTIIAFVSLVFRESFYTIISS